MDLGIVEARVAAANAVEGDLPHGFRQLDRELDTLLGAHRPIDGELPAACLGSGVEQIYRRRVANPCDGE